MTDTEFSRQQQAAVERMREMNARARSQPNYNYKPTKPQTFVNSPQRGTQKSSFQNTAKSEFQKAKSSPPPDREEPKHINQNPNGLNFPLFDMLSTDKDATLIIGLLLILMSENSDKILLFALVYILL